MHTKLIELILKCTGNLFYPRDASIAQYSLRPALCPPVCYTSYQWSIIVTMCLILSILWHFVLLCDCDCSLTLKIPSVSMQQLKCQYQYQCQQWILAHNRKASNGL